MLGIGIERDREKRTISFSQTAYIQKIVECFRMEEAKHLTDDTEAGNVVMQSRAASHQSGNTDNVTHQLVRSDSESSEQLQRKIGTEAEHWAAVEKDAAQQKC